MDNRLRKIPLSQILITFTKVSGKKTSSESKLDRPVFTFNQTNLPGRK